MKILIRDYRDSDAEACRSLWGELAQHHAEIYEDPSIAGDDPGRGFEPYMDNTQLKGIWVAEVENQVVGCAGLIIYGENAEIEPVIVSSTYRGKDIGTALVSQIVKVAKNSKVRFLCVRPVARNTEAIHLFTRLGFNLVGHVELFQDLSQSSERQWKSGIVLHGSKLRY